MELIKPKRGRVSKKDKIFLIKQQEMIRDRILKTLRIYSSKQGQIINILKMEKGRGTYAGINRLIKMERNISKNKIYYYIWKTEGYKLMKNALSKNEIKKLTVSDMVKYTTSSEFYLDNQEFIRDVWADRESGKYNTKQARRKIAALDTENKALKANDQYNRDSLDEAIERINSQF